MLEVNILKMYFIANCFIFLYVLAVYLLLLFLLIQASTNNVSSSLTYHASTNSSNPYSTKSSAISREGKYNTTQQIPTSRLISPQSYQRPALPTSEPPGFSSVSRTTPGGHSQPQVSVVVVRRPTSNGPIVLSTSTADRPSWRTSAEQIIEEELKEMKKREEDLVLVCSI